MRDPHLRVCRSRYVGTSLPVIFYIIYLVVLFFKDSISYDFIRFCAVIHSFIYTSIH